jgi:hypothetical protein
LSIILGRLATHGLAASDETGHWWCSSRGLSALDHNRVVVWFDDDRSGT